MIKSITSMKSIKAKLGIRSNVHPNSLKNLAKGPAALAKLRAEGVLQTHGGNSLTARLKDYLESPPTKKPGDKAPLRDHLAYSTLEGAIKREPTPLNLVWDRLEGRVVEKHAILGNLQIEVVYGSAEQPRGDTTLESPI